MKTLHFFLFVNYQLGWKFVELVVKVKVMGKTIDKKEAP